MVAKLIIKESVKALRKRAAKRRSQAKERLKTKSLDKYNIHATGKGPVPFKKQSPIKSTLSGRTYSTLGKGRGSNFRADPTIGSGAAEFQSRVRDLIGLDSRSVRAAHFASHRARKNRKNRLKKK
jgi:hypothetical protein